MDRIGMKFLALAAAKEHNRPYLTWAHRGKENWSQHVWTSDGFRMHLVRGFPDFAGDHIPFVSSYDFGDTPKQSIKGPSLDNKTEESLGISDDPSISLSISSDSVALISRFLKAFKSPKLAAVHLQLKDPKTFVLHNGAGYLRVEASHAVIQKTLTNRWVVSAQYLSDALKADMGAGVMFRAIEHPTIRDNEGVVCAVTQIGLWPDRYAHIMPVFGGSDTPLFEPE